MLSFSYPNYHIQFWHATILIVVVHSVWCGLNKSSWYNRFPHFQGNLYIRFRAHEGCSLNMRLYIQSHKLNLQDRICTINNQFSNHQSMPQATLKSANFCRTNSHIKYYMHIPNYMAPSSTRVSPLQWQLNRTAKKCNINIILPHKTTRARDEKHMTWKMTLGKVISMCFSPKDLNWISSYFINSHSHIINLYRVWFYLQTRQNPPTTLLISSSQHVLFRVLLTVRLQMNVRF